MIYANRCLTSFIITYKPATKQSCKIMYVAIYVVS